MGTLYIHWSMGIIITKPNFQYLSLYRSAMIRPLEAKTISCTWQPGLVIGEAHGQNDAKTSGKDGTVMGNVLMWWKTFRCVFIFFRMYGNE